MDLQLLYSLFQEPNPYTYKRMNTKLVLALTALIVFSVKAGWETTSLDRITILIGIDSSDQSDSDFVVGAGQNGVGYGIASSTDSGETFTFEHPQGSLMNLAAGVSRDGTVQGLGGLGVFTRTSGEEDFTKIDVSVYSPTMRYLSEMGEAKWSCAPQCTLCWMLLH